MRVAAAAAHAICGAPAFERRAAYENRLKIMLVLWPPKPKELLIA